MIRFRIKLTHVRTGLKAQVHAVMAKNGILPSRGDMWGRAAAPSSTLSSFPDAYFNRIAVLRDLIDAFDREIVFLDRDIHLILDDDAGYNAVQAIYGVGRLFAAVFVAEIGDVTRFDSPKALCSWAGLTPSTRSPTSMSIGAGSPNKAHAWCAGPPSRPWPATTAGNPSRKRFESIAERRGKNRANVAIARKVLTLVYYGLRDGEIRCLADQDAA